MWQQCWAPYPRERCFGPNWVDCHMHLRVGELWPRPYLGCCWRGQHSLSDSPLEPLFATDESGLQTIYFGRNVVGNDEGDQVVLAVIATDSVAEVSGVFGKELCESRHGGRNEMETACCQVRRKILEDVSWISISLGAKFPKLPRR
jgi:hypothetical protein